MTIYLRWTVQDSTHWDPMLTLFITDAIAPGCQCVRVTMYTEHGGNERGQSLCVCVTEVGSSVGGTTHSSTVMIPIIPTLYCMNVRDNKRMHSRRSS